MQRNKHKAQAWLDIYFQQAISTADSAPDTVLIRGARTLDDVRLLNVGGADLIVMGHRERQGLPTTRHNNISPSVLYHAPDSVLVIQGLPQVDEFHRIDRTCANQIGADTRGKPFAAPDASGLAQLSHEFSPT